jgi:hypothetical protein
MPRPTQARLFGLLALLLVFIGCSAAVKTVAIKGAITKDGKPVITSKKGFVSLSFHPEGGGNSVPALVDSQQGTYEVKAIPAGKYKVAVQQMDPAPATDKLKGAFDVTRTKVVREVRADGEVPIDLSQP